VQPPHRILTILEGESLLNDATALMIYRLAVGAAVTQTFSIGDVAPAFAFAVIGSIVIGPALAWLFLRLTRNVEDVPSAIVLQFVGTFGIWMLAEHLRLSAVLTVVCFAIAIARRAPESTPARIRIPSYAVWDTVVFVMNVLAFVLIGSAESGRSSPASSPACGLNISPSQRPCSQPSSWSGSPGCSATSAWRGAINRLRGYGPRRPMLPPTYKGAGSRRLVRHAGHRDARRCLALPAGLDAGAVHFRDLIVLTAFSVVLGTLVVQGLTLKAVLRAVNIRDDDPVGRETGLARERALRAALASVEGDSSPAAEAVRQEYTRHLKERAGRPVDSRAGGIR
jgi:CPA1 family monovalent cation:H+ antiporter